MATTSLQDVSLGIRDIGVRTTFAGAGATDLSAEEDRFANVILSEGLIKPADSFDVAKGAGATMNVVVGSGSSKSDYFVVDGEDLGQGKYIVRLEGATETFALAAADPSNARKDEIYIVVQDNAYDSSSRALAVLAIREGDPAASPVVPGPDAGWKGYALLATVDVPASAADILATTITDNRATATTELQAKDAALLDGIDSTGFSLSSHNHDLDYADIAHEDNTTGHPVATASVDGFMDSADKTKLNTIETSATADQSASEILTAIKTVDGTGSGLDADLLDGKHLATIGPEIIDFQVNNAVAVVAIGTSPTDHHSFTYVPPGGWTTYDLVVMAVANYENGSSGALLSTKVSVGGDESSNQLFNIESSAESASVGISHERASLSGNQTIKMTTQRSGGTQADSQCTGYTMIAYRKS